MLVSYPYATRLSMFELGESLDQAVADAEAAAQALRESQVAAAAAARAKSAADDRAREVACK